MLMGSMLVRYPWTDSPCLVSGPNQCREDIDRRWRERERRFTSSVMAGCVLKVEDGRD